MKTKCIECNRKNPKILEGICEECIKDYEKPTSWVFLILLVLLQIGLVYSLRPITFEWIAVGFIAGVTLMLIIQRILK